jgi:hypothetical protein
MKLLACWLALAAAAPWDFQGVPAGQLPPGWKATLTGDGPVSVWKVVQDGQRKVLAQTSSKTLDKSYNLCIAEGTSFRDLDMSVAIRPVGGRNDQGGGLVWRYRDRNNYYIARWNPLEVNFRVYKVVDGKRTQLDSADVMLPTDRWHTLAIRQMGSHVECSLDGVRYLKATDDTFTDAGKIGLWTKADAVSHFDHLTVAEVTP